MKSVKRVFSVAIADFLERSRQYNFLIAIGLTIFIVVSCIPKNESSFGIMNFQGYRGIYNSAWIGCSLAFVSSTIISLIGFYIVKNTISRDEETGVGQIIASTSMTKLQYCVGKALSNLILLLVIMFIIMAVAVMMQFIRGEDRHINLLQLSLPFFIITLPTIIVVSSLAVFFESIKCLRSVSGNVIYFLIWTYLISEIVSNRQYVDLLGAKVVLDHITTDIKSVFYTYEGSFTILGTVQNRGGFIWSGINWSWNIIINRYLWILVSILIIFLSSIFFDRFSNQYNSKRFSSKKISNDVSEIKSSCISFKYISEDLEKLDPVSFRLSYFQLILGEIKIVLRGRHFSWYIILSILFYLSAFSSLKLIEKFILPLIYLWTIVLWSNTSSHQYKNKTELVLLHTKNYEIKQLISSYLAAAIMFFTIGFGAIFSFNLSVLNSIFLW